jgi:multicomponent Na+:H+ antiporter subunit A
VTVLLGVSTLLAVVGAFRGVGDGSKSQDRFSMLAFIPAILGWLGVMIPLYSGSDAYLTMSQTPTIGSLMMSMLFGTLAVGLFWVWNPSRMLGFWHRLHVPVGAKIFDQIWGLWMRFGNVLEFATFRNTLGFGLLPLVLVSVVVCWMSFPWTGWPLPDINPDVGVLETVAIISGAVIIVGSWILIRAISPVVGVLFLGLTGYGLALLFAILGAPDLALTQFSMETLSVVVLLMLMRKSPSFSRYRFKNPLPWGGVCALLGVTVGFLSYTGAQLRVDSRLESYFSENSWPLAFGRNVVNVILVDFRALDTLGEITVVLIAGLGVVLLASGRRRV